MVLTLHCLVSQFLHQFVESLTCRHQYREGDPSLTGVVKHPPLASLLVGSILVSEVHLNSVYWNNLCYLFVSLSINECANIYKFGVLTGLKPALWGKWNIYDCNRILLRKAKIKYGAGNSKCYPPYWKAV